MWLSRASHAALSCRCALRPASLCALASEEEGESEEKEEEKEEKWLFVEQIDICLRLVVRHPPQRLAISPRDKTSLLDGAIAAAGRKPTEAASQGLYFGG